MCGKYEVTRWEARSTGNELWGLSGLVDKCQIYNWHDLLFLQQWARHWKNSLYTDRWGGTGDIETTYFLYRRYGQYILAKKRELFAIPIIEKKQWKPWFKHHKPCLAEEEWAFIQKHQIKALFYTDKGYPYRLKAYEDSPVLLYYKGTRWSGSSKKKEKNRIHHRYHKVTNGSR